MLFFRFYFFAVMAVSQCYIAIQIHRGSRINCKYAGCVVYPLKHMHNQQPTFIEGFISLLKYEKFNMYLSIPFHGELESFSCPLPSSYQFLWTQLT